MKYKILSGAVAFLAIGCGLVPGVARAESPQDNPGYLFDLSGIGSDFGKKASAAGVHFKLAARGSPLFESPRPATRFAASQNASPIITRRQRCSTTARRRSRKLTSCAASASS